MILYLLILLLILYLVIKYFSKEGFEQSSVFKTFIGNIDDEFYTKIYDEVIHMLPYEKTVIELLEPYFNNNTNCLCVGSKTGHIVQLLSSINVTGVDKSYEMVKMSEYKYPSNKYIYGDYNSSFLFQQNTFTIILCPLFTIYTCDLPQFLSNANTWLVHQGYLCVMHYKDGFNIKHIKNHYPSQYFKINYSYTIELDNNKLTEKIINKQNKLRTNIQYLNTINLDKSTTDAGFRKIKELDIPNFPFVFLSIYQKF